MVIVNNGELGTEQVGALGTVLTTRCWSVRLLERGPQAPPHSIPETPVLLAWGS